jgi:rod shape-determining protein MreC
MPRLRRAALILLVVWLAAQPSARGALRALLEFPLTALRAAATAVATLPRLPRLLREQQRLAERSAQQQVELARLREALREDEAAARLARAWPAGGTPAKVIGRSFVPTQQSIMLNRGSRDGLRVGGALLDDAGLVGRVAELGDGHALALLITDAQSRVAGLVDRSRETGLVVGRGPGVCELTYLEADADIEPGDRVVSAGLGETVPKGLALGTVVRVARDHARGSARAWLRPAARLGRLEDVWCLPPEPTGP